MEEIIMKYRNTFGTTFNTIMEAIPGKIEEVTNILTNLDEDKVKGLLEMVQGTNVFNKTATE